MNSVSDDFKDLLVAGGAGKFGATEGWSIAIGHQPDEPDECITVYEVPGRVTEETFDGMNEIEELPVQVRVRATSFQRAFEKSKQVREILNRNSTNIESIPNDTCYLSISIATPSYPLGGRDSQNRFTRIQTFNAHRKEA